VPPLVLSYEELKKEILEQLHKAKIGSLATAEGDDVTVRQMAIIPEGLTIFCFTGVQTRKYKQIVANPNVALAIGNMQIEGTASLKGRTSDEANVWFLKRFEALFPELYGKFFRQLVEDPETTERLIEIRPKRIALYAPACLDVLHIGEKKAVRYDLRENYG